MRPAWCSRKRTGGYEATNGTKKAGRKHCTRWAGATCHWWLGVLYCGASHASTLVIESELMTLANYLLALVLLCSVDQIDQFLLKLFRDRAVPYRFIPPDRKLGSMYRFVAELPHRSIGIRYTARQ